LKIGTRGDAREDFLARLEKRLPVTKTSCFAWALIPSHAHFIFRAGNVPIAALMRRLLFGIDEKFERYYDVKRSGYDLDKTAKRAASLCAVELEDIFSRRKHTF
jgi:hypothetical protein